EAILALIRKHQIATQEDLVRHLHRAGIDATQATVSRDLAELGLVRVAGPESHYVRPQEGLGLASPQGREERLQRLLRDLPMTVKRGQGLAVLITLPARRTPWPRRSTPPAGRSWSERWPATTPSSWRSARGEARMRRWPSAWLGSAPTSSPRTDAGKNHPCVLRRT